MDFDDLDLDINNYNYNEILELLNLNNNFNEHDLKESKKLILKLHPDKCNIKKEIFIFYSEVYNLVYKVWKTTQHNTRDLETMIAERNINQDINKTTIKNFKNNKNFNKVFNELFESIYIRKNDGYQEWFKSNSDLLDNLNENETKELFNKLKLEQTNKQALIKNNYEITNKTHTNIYDETEDSYSSDVFSKLNFDDLKHAHGTNVIPVNEQTYLDKKKTIKSLEQTRIERGIQINPLNNKDSIKILQNEKQLFQQQSLTLKIQQQINDNNQKQKMLEGWSKYKLINN